MHSRTVPAWGLVKRSAHRLSCQSRREWVGTWRTDPPVAPRASTQDGRSERSEESRSSDGAVECRHRGNWKKAVYLIIKSYKILNRKDARNNLLLAKTNISCLSHAVEYACAHLVRWIARLSHLESLRKATKLLLLVVWMRDDLVHLHRRLTRSIFEGVTANKDLKIGKGVELVHAVGGGQQPAARDYRGATEGVVACMWSGKRNKNSRQ